MNSLVKATLTFALMFGGVVHASEIRIGAAAPLSGAQAKFGQTLQSGMKMYFSEVNARGGIKGQTLTLVQGDDKADPREGTLVAQKFCDGDIKAVLGHFNSGVQMATLPIYMDCDMPEVTLASNPEITKQHAQNLVRPTASDFAQGGLAANYATQDLKLKTAMTVDDKQVFGQGVTQIFSDGFVKGGGKILGKVSVNTSDIDFTAVITQIKSKNPSVVYFGGVMPQLALFAKQMNEQGLDAQLMVPDGAFTPDFIKQAGEVAALRALITFAAPPLDSSTELVEFTKNYKKAFGVEAEPLSAYGYVAAQIIATAIDKAGEPSRASILSQLKSIKLDSILGHIEFDATGELTIAPMYLYKIQGDDFKMIANNQ